MPVRKFPVTGLLAVLAIWFAGMGLVATAVRPDTVIAFGSPADMAAAAGSDGYLLGAGRFYVAAGAWFVWPVIGKGCERR